MILKKTDYLNYLSIFWSFVNLQMNGIYQLGERRRLELIPQPKHLAPPAKRSREKRDRAKGPCLDTPSRRERFLEGVNKAFDDHERPLKAAMEAFVALFSRGEQTERRRQQARGKRLFHREHFG